ncbi:MAG: ATP-binding cassette domain-containing protein [Bacteroidetes bacterium]|nr:ATP-binding cassette domain-containing protein [Bacteroidota bacterium]
MSGKRKRNAGPNQPGLFSLLGPYRKMIVLLLLFAIISNGINLVIPKIISKGIDDFSAGNFDYQSVILWFGLATLFIFIFEYLQSVIQTFASEKVARDLRTKLSDKISKQTYSYVETTTPARLLTNLTSDIDSIKMFVSTAIVSIISSVFIIIGASILLISINWRLALAVLMIIPIIGGTFFFVLRKVRVLFIRSREVIDWLNRVINESILGSTLIRVLNSQQLEYNKFIGANTEARDIGLSILKLFATLIPIVTFTANLATLTVLALGGHFVIGDTMTLGEFAAFNSYIAMLIFPIILIGFMSSVIAQANASNGRIQQVLNTPETEKDGEIKSQLKGKIELKDVTISYDGHLALKNVSFIIEPGSKTAVIGPTAAGKTQLLYLLTGLIKPTSGEIEFDGTPISAFEKQNFHTQIGFVFQDSIVFNMSIRENIAFNKNVTDADLEKAIETAELKDFIDRLPDGLNTIVSERGSDLSGGQKQRIMLARALALNPKILLLDDFTARVDLTTEKKILDNVEKHYPGITLLSITQKIASVEHYDKIVLMMQGEVISEGTHSELMKTSSEYIQISNSQRSTSNYELQS